MEGQAKQGNLTRREFIRQGSTAAAAAVAGMSVLGAPAILRAQNLNSNLNVGVLGTGSRGCYMTRFLVEAAGVTISDVCDIYPPHLEEGKKDSGNPKVRAHEKWEEVLEQKDVDAVLIAPPLFLHVPMSVAALDAGKHVYSEKSMGLTTKQLNEMGEAVKAHPDKVYLVGYQSRMSEAFKQAKSLIQGGSFGQINEFYVHYDNNRIWRQDDVDPKWERVLNWRLYREYCGGIITELLCHEIDMMLDILDTQAVSGSCNGKILVYKDQREHHDNLMGHWQMESGAIGMASGTLTNSRWGASWAVHGPYGTLEFLGNAFRIFWEKDTRHLQDVGAKHKFNIIKLGQSLSTPDTAITQPDKLVEFPQDGDASSKAAVAHWVDCIRNGTKPIMDYATARRTSIAALVLYESSLNEGRQFTTQEIEAMG